jgi:hypothetical protein
MNENLFALPDSMRRFKKIAVGLFIVTMSWAMNLHATELHIGKATADITPKIPVALMGQDC